MQHTFVPGYIIPANINPKFAFVQEIEPKGISGSKGHWAKVKGCHTFVPPDTSSLQIPIVQEIEPKGISGSKVKDHNSIM
jgi:hypothetical protein